MKIIPNLFTLLNLAFGFAAIVFILQTGETLVVESEGVWLPRLPERIAWGALCIGIAAIVDFLDGFVARLFRAESAMGRELDSLADLVSFGVAPGLILYQLLRLSLAAEEYGLDASAWALAPVVLFPCAGAWRLARFNVTNRTGLHFQGIPIPAAGLVVASFPMVLHYDHYPVAELLLNRWVLYGTVLVLSALMVSDTPFMSLKLSGRTLQSNWPKFLLVAVAIIAALFLQWLAVPLVFLVYVLLSLIIQKQLK